jgi:nicotinamidase-related amidase
MFGVPELKPAVLAIDLHRGHLDPEVATMPLEARLAAQVVDANERLFKGARAAGVPIVHALTSYRSDLEIRNNPFWLNASESPTATRRNVLVHNVEGSPGIAVMPELLDERDLVVDTKKRYDCFIATDLDFMLRALGVNTLFLTGVNTNSCVLATTVAACVRDYAAVVVEDCVETMDTPEVHESALTCVRAAFGWVRSTDEVLEMLPARAGAGA